MQPRSLSWMVNGLRLEGLCWGDATGRPLLCLHGWLDNAASFSLLAPLLEGYHVVAVDLTGHGRSSRRSADAGYQVWDDLPELDGLVAQLGWDQFNLMGHSRGAVIGSLFASTRPQRIRRLVLLDAVMPRPVAEAAFPVQMARFMADKKRLLNRDSRVFVSFAEAVRTREDTGLTEQAARLLVERNLKACAGGYTWTIDPRLQGASAVKLTGGQIRAVLEKLTMPTLLLLAAETYVTRPELAADARRYVAQLTVEAVEGGHHFHMEAGAAHVARRVMEFLRD